MRRIANPDSAWGKGVKPHDPSINEPEASTLTEEDARALQREVTCRLMVFLADMQRTAPRRAGRLAIIPALAVIFGIYGQREAARLFGVDHRLVGRMSHQIQSQLAQWQNIASAHRPQMPHAAII